METSRQQQVRFYHREQHSQRTLSQETRHMVLNSALSIRAMHEVIGPPGPSRRTALSVLARKVWDSSWRETVRTSMGPPAAKRLKKSWICVSDQLEGSTRGAKGLLECDGGVGRGGPFRMATKRARSAARVTIILCDKLRVRTAANCRPKRAWRLAVAALGLVG